MAQGSGNTFHSAIVEGNHTAVAQRQLDLTLTLLAGNLTRHRTVHLVGEPVLTGNGLQLEHVLDILLKGLSLGRVGGGSIMALYGLVHHIGLGRMTEHLGHIEVERLDAVALLEREVGIAGGLTDHIQRGTLALGNLAYMLDMLFVDEQAHALLTLVGNDFLG